MDEDYHKRLDDFVDQLRDRPEFGLSLADHYYNTHIEYWLKSPKKLVSGFEVGVRIQPHPIAYYILGSCYANQHKYDDAIINFKKVLDYNPKFYLAIEELALLQQEHHLLGKEFEYFPENVQEFFKEIYSLSKPGRLRWQRITEGGHIICLRYKWKDMFGFETDFGDICSENVSVTETSKGFLKVRNLYDIFDKHSLSCTVQLSMGNVSIGEEVSENRKKKFKELTEGGNAGRPNQAIQRWTKVFMKRFGYKFHSGYHESDNYEDFVNGKNFGQRFSWLHAAFLPSLDMHKDNQISVLMRPPK